MLIKYNYWNFKYKYLYSLISIRQKLNYLSRILVSEKKGQRQRRCFMLSGPFGNSPGPSREPHQSFFLSETSVGPFVENPFVSAPLQSTLPVFLLSNCCTAFLGHMRLTTGYMYGSRNFLKIQSSTGMTIQGMHTIVPRWISETADTTGEEVSSSQISKRRFRNRTVSTGRGSYLEKYLPKAKVSKPKCSLCKVVEQVRRQEC